MEDNLTEFEGSQVQGLDLDIQDDDDVLSSLNVANETAKRLNDSRLERVADVDEANAALIEQQEEQAKDQGFIADNPVQAVQEVGKALYGGATDAVESIGSFVDLTGDTIMSISNRIQGNPQEYGQNPFAFREYLNEGGASPGILDIPDKYEVTNYSGAGKLVRGLVEFGLLTYATSLTGGAMAPTMFGKSAQFANKVKGAKLLRGALKNNTPLIGGMVRGVARTGKGSKFIRFIPKGGQIAAEGSIADLISSSSDYGNMANLLNEYAPWLPFSEFLSVDPDKDNPWTARIKAIFAGAGLNIAGYTVVAFGRGRYAAMKARKAGKTIDEANTIGNKVMDDSIRNDVAEEYKQRNDLKKEDIKKGEGVPEDPYGDYIIQHLDDNNLGALYKSLTKGNLDEVVGNDAFFHGSHAGLLGDYPHLNLNERRWNDENLFGNGFYSTDDLTVAAVNRDPTKGLVIARDKDGLKKVVYRLKQKGKVKFLDADKLYNWNSKAREVQAFKRAGLLDDTGEFASAWPTAGKVTYSQYVDLIKERQYYPREEVTAVLDEINKSLAELGYGGITYTAKQGDKAHRVRVYWDPDNQIDLDRYNLANRSEFETEMPIFEEGNFKHRPPRQPYKTNIEAGRGLKGSQGAQYLIDRLGKRFMAKGVDEYEAIEVQEFIELIGERFFDDVSLSFTNKLGPKGRFNFGNKLVEIQQKAMEEEGLTEVMIHELWHSLSRYLPQADVKKLTVEFKNRKAKWLATGTKDVELFNKGRYTSTNYRYKNIDEWFAETMSDEFYTYQRETAQYQLAPSGTWKRLGQEVSILLKDMYATVASRLGGSQARRIFGNYKRQRYTEMRKSYMFPEPATLEFEQMGLEGWNPIIDDFDDITSVETFKEMTDGDDFKRLKKDELENIAKNKGARKNDAWDETTGRSNAGKDTDPTPDRNPNNFSDDEKTVFPDGSGDLKDKTKKLLKEMIDQNGSTSNQILIEKQIRRLADGSESLYKFVKEFSTKLTDEVFENLNNSFDHNKVQSAILRQAEEIYARIDADIKGGGTSKNLNDYFKKNPKDRIEYTHNGNKVVTGTAEQKIALELVVQTLAKRASMFATGGLDLPAGANKTRQLKHANDSLIIALREYKKIGFMTGSELARQNPKGRLLPEDARRLIESELTKIDEDFAAFHKELERLTKEGDDSLRADLLEMHALSGGKVFTYDDMTQFMRVLSKGGRFKGQNYKSGIREQMRGMFYNSVLSSVRTPIKAIVGTNFLALMRPFQAWVGAAMGGNKQEMIIAAAQIHGINEMFAESMKMFKHNWDLGINRKAQTYVGKFNVETNTKEFKDMAKFVYKYGTPSEQQAYKIAETLLDFNNSPWVRYSQNAMGAGDALARNLLGRFDMRMKAARAAIDQGVDLDDVIKVATNTEENFRRQIFKKDKYDMWVVSDKAASMAGDEIALTKALTGNLKGLEAIGKLTGFRLFFPFVRTGVNAIDLTFQHTPGIARFHSKYKDFMEYARTGANADYLMKEYGVAKADIPNQIAILKGREATGAMLVSLAAGAAITGNMTGMMPYDKETRDLWRANKIQPNSFKIGDTYISYGDIEPFNSILTSVANVMNYQYALGEDVRDNMLEKIMFMATAVLVDKSMLAGVEDLAQVLSGSTSEIQLQRIAAKLVRSQVPYSGLSAQLGNLVDENERISRGFFETLVKRDLAFKTSLPAKYDILEPGKEAVKFSAYTTNPIMKLWNSLSPVAITYAGNNKVKKALRDISFNLPETLRTWKGEELNSFEQSELQRYLAESDLYERLDKLISSQSWQNQLEEYKRLGLMKREGFAATDQKFYIDVQRIFLQEKKQAIARLRREHPALYQRIKERTSYEFYSKKGNYNIIQNLVNIPK